MRFVAGAACAYLVICFFHAAFLKCRSFREFSASVAAIVPFLARGSPFLAGAVIAAETGIASLLVVSVIDDSLAFREAAGFASLGLALTFAGAIASVICFERDVVCNCFGEDQAPISTTSLIGPVMVFIAAAALLTTNDWPQAIGIWVAAAAAGLYLLLIHRAVLLASRSDDR